MRQFKMTRTLIIQFQINTITQSFSPYLWENMNKKQEEACRNLFLKRFTLIISSHISISAKNYRKELEVGL